MAKKMHYNSVLMRKRAQLMRKLAELKYLGTDLLLFNAAKKRRLLATAASGLLGFGAGYVANKLIASLPTTTGGLLSGGALGTVAAGLTYKLMDPDRYMINRQLNQINNNLQDTTETPKPPEQPAPAPENKHRDLANKQHKLLQAALAKKDIKAAMAAAKSLEIQKSLAEWWLKREELLSWTNTLINTYIEHPWQAGLPSTILGSGLVGSTIYGATKIPKLLDAYKKHVTPKLKTWDAALKDGIKSLFKRQKLLIPPVPPTTLDPRMYLTSADEKDREVYKAYEDSLAGKATAEQLALIEDDRKKGSPIGTQVLLDKQRFGTIDSDYARRVLVATHFADTETRAKLMATLQDMESNGTGHEKRKARLIRRLIADFDKNRDVFTAVNTQMLKLALRAQRSALGASDAQQRILDMSARDRALLNQLKGLLDELDARALAAQQQAQQDEADKLKAQQDALAKQKAALVLSAEYKLAEGKPLSLPERAALTDARNNPGYIDKYQADLKAYVDRFLTHAYKARKTVALLMGTSEGRLQLEQEIATLKQGSIVDKRSAAALLMLRKLYLQSPDAYLKASGKLLSDALAAGNNATEAQKATIDWAQNNNPQLVYDLQVRLDAVRQAQQDAEAQKQQEAAKMDAELKAQQAAEAQKQQELYAKTIADVAGTLTPISLAQRQLLLADEQKALALLQYTLLATGMDADTAKKTAEYKLDRVKKETKALELAYKIMHGKHALTLDLINFYMQNQSLVDNIRGTLGQVYGTRGGSGTPAPGTSGRRSAAQGVGTGGAAKKRPKG